MGGTPEEKPEAYRQTNIIPDVPKIKAALLIQYGTADPQLPPYESEQLIQALKKANKPFLAYAYPGEYHEFFKPEDRIDVWRHQQAFLRKYLQSRTGQSSTSIEDINLTLPWGTGPHTFTLRSHQRRAPTDRKNWLRSALSAALFTRPEPDRKGMVKTQTTSPMRKSKNKPSARRGNRRSHPPHYT